MWTRWRPQFHRVSAASSAALRRPAVLSVRESHASRSTESIRALSTSSGSLQAEQLDREDPSAKVRRCLNDLSRAVRGARSPAQLTAMWSVLSRHEPVVIHGAFLRRVGAPVKPHDETSERVEIPADGLAVRMLSPEEMAANVEEGKRNTVIENAPSFVTSPSFLNAIKDEPETTSEASTGSDIVVPHDRVLLLSETFVARKIIWALHRLRSHQELTRFVDAFEATRTDDAATLGNHIDALYVASLGAQRSHAKVIERFEGRAQSDLTRYLANRDAFRSLLNACMFERNGRLARQIIDQALDGPTLTTFNVKVFTLALHACLRGESKTLDGLNHAMHIYRRMFHEVGYILAPPEWSMLLNASVYVGQHDLTMEIFRDYRAHGIAAFQKRFQQALRTACRSGQYDTAVAMARTWIELEKEDNEDWWRREAEAECLNKILWEMLKGSPTSQQVEDVLALMQLRGFNAGALVIRRVVTHFFSTAVDEDDLAPEAVLYRFFHLWECVPDTIQRTSFVLHLVLEECEAREWSDQCERVIEYALDKKIELPIASTVKLMDRYAERGDFDDAIQLGELVLQPWFDKASRSKSKHHSNTGLIPDAFFESLLRCYLFRERFDDVVRVDDAFQLTVRRSGANSALATILLDARAMAD